MLWHSVVNFGRLLCNQKQLTIHGYGYKSLYGIGITHYVTLVPISHQLANVSIGYVINAIQVARARSRVSVQKKHAKIG